ncbi:MAG TPA: dihydrofolate reductase family protein [Flavisolibacter sp.]
MRKLIAAINMTLDGFCDHTVITPDEEIHQHYTNLLANAGLILYGKTTYQLMQFWQTVLTNPSDEKSMNDFARAIDRIPKLVFSHTLKTTDWNSAELAGQSLEEVVREQRQLPGKDILVGSRSLILQLMQRNLIDEYQLCVHPVVAGSGLPLFENINRRTVFNRIKTKQFAGGAVLLYYAPATK